VATTVGGEGPAGWASSGPELFRERLHALVLGYLPGGEDGWRTTVADRAVEAVNDAMWQALGETWSIEACAHVDRLATRLVSSPGPGEVDDEDVEALAIQVGAPSWMALYVGWLAATVADAPAADRPTAAAGVVRAFGIAACVDRGVTARCPCLLNGRSPVRDLEPAPRDTGESSAAQVFYDFAVGTVLDGIRAATADLFWETLNEAVARDLDAQWDGDVVAALNGVASALDALREALQATVRTSAGYVIGHSGLPPWAQEAGVRLMLGLTSQLYSTQLHVTALGLRLFGACLEIELEARGRMVPAADVVDDPRVRPIVEDLWDLLEPLHVQRHVVGLFVGALEPLRSPTQWIDPRPDPLFPTLEPTLAPGSPEFDEAPAALPLPDEVIRRAATPEPDGRSPGMSP